MAESMQDPAAKQFRFPLDRCLDQFQSPLFEVLPAELRLRIFSYVLADEEDVTRMYSVDTYYKRPDYSAPRKTHVSILRTCQRIYRESWYMPWANSEHSFFLADSSRRPARVTTVADMTSTLGMIHASHIKTDIQHVRIFAQCCGIESGESLQSILSIPHFSPVHMTITIRHTDFWYWETDEVLHIDGHWTRVCKFPTSTKMITVEFESLERKKDQVDQIAQQALRRWKFVREDGVVLGAETEDVKITKWTGSSCWGGRRWVRDETRPEVLDYYVAAVTFRARRDSVSLPIEGGQLTDLPTVPEGLVLRADGMPSTTLPNVVNPIALSEIEQAGIPKGTNADEVVRLIIDWRRARREERLVRRRTRLPPRRAFM